MPRLHYDWVHESPGGDEVHLAGCFLESELIQTGANQCVPMGSLKIGDKLWTWDADRKKAQYTAITDIHKYEVNEVICFNGAMRVSTMHPLLTDSGMPFIAGNCVVKANNTNDSIAWDDASMSQKLLAA